MLGMIKLEINWDVLKQRYITSLIIKDSLSKRKFTEVIADLDHYASIIQIAS